MTTAVVRWAARLSPARRATVDALPPFDPADFDPGLSTRLLILQPTPFCNIDCDYCYLPDRRSTARMSMATVRVAAQRLLDDGLVGPALTVVWHAGEPMTLPVSYYDEAFGVLAETLRDHTELTHSMQTNAMRVDDGWCALIHRWDVRIGVSIDGTQAMHDARRRTRSGRGTHAASVRGLQRLQSAGIDCHAIAVVGPMALADPDAFLDAFEALGISRLGCNFDEQEGAHAASSMVGREADHQAFLARLAERTDTRASPLNVRELATARALIASPLPRYRWRGHVWPDNAQVTPFALVNVAHGGEFSSFSPELLGQPSPDHGNFVFGHVERDGYLASTRGAAFLDTWRAIVRGVLACERTCAHFGFCGGGAPANKHYELGDLGGTETVYCRTMLQRPLATLLERAETRLRRDFTSMAG